MSVNKYRTFSKKYRNLLDNQKNTGKGRTICTVINCLYQPGRAEGGRGVAYPYVNQLYRTRLDVVIAGHVMSVAPIGRCYEF